jgi:hypothetical protein
VNWLIHSQAGLVTRIVVGATVLAALGLWDLKKNGRHATRWREYTFLLACTLAAMVYGVLNDQITSSISWEYFYFGKSLEERLGLNVPPAPGALHWEAAKIGMQATWSVGLILGAAMLIANNPRRTRPQLSYLRMLRILPGVFLIAIAFAIVGGIAGYFGCLNWASPDFAEMWTAQMFRPRRFIGVWGVHLGGYVGGLLAAVWAVYHILHCRRTLGTHGNSPTDHPNSM